MQVPGKPGRRLGDDCLIEHQQDSPHTFAELPFEPPFAWRHVTERRASRCQGRCQQISKRTRAKLTLCRETVSWCVSCRYWVSSGSIIPFTVRGRPLRTPLAKRSQIEVAPVLEVSDPVVDGLTCRARAFGHCGKTSAVVESEQGLYTIQLLGLTEYMKRVPPRRCSWRLSMLSLINMRVSGMR
jgi:hypothetical protein